MFAHVIATLEMNEVDEEDLFPCKEFSEFKAALLQERVIDDKIVCKLNTSIPTQSFAGLVSAKEQCTALYQQLLTAHSRRRRGIQSCIDHTRKEVQDLHASPDPAHIRQLKKEQTKLRLIQSELVVEDVVKERSMKVFKERCWQSYRVPES